MNILIIVAEISFVLFVFFFLNLFVSNLCKILLKTPTFKSQERNIKTLRRNFTGILILACLALCILLVGVNSFLLYRGEDLQQYKLNWIRAIPSQFWINTAISIVQSLGILMLTAIAVRLLNYGLKVVQNRVDSFERLTANDESVTTFFSSLKSIVTIGTWAWALILCTELLRLPGVFAQNLYILLRIYLIVTIGQLIPKAVNAIIDTLDALSVKYPRSDNLLLFYNQLRHLIPFLKRCLEYAIYIFIATLVVQQIELFANLASLGPRIVKIIGIIFISRVFVELARLLVEEVLFKEQNLTEVEKQKHLTIIPLIHNFFKYLIYFSAAVFILYTLDINPAPILAGAGILGITLGLGAQHLVNDIVCGFFILFENYYLVGDYIEAGKAEDKVVEGVVESIELRTTRVRHPNGQLQIIRNGDIGSITNYSKQYIYAVVEISVPYDSNLAHVYRVIEEVGQQLKAENPDILAATQVDGLDNLGEQNLLLRTLTKVKPGKHLHIQRLIRRTFMDVFIQEGIFISTRLES